MDDFDKILFENKAVEDFKQAMKTIGRQVTNMEVKDIPEIEWFLVWDNGSLKPTINFDEKGAWDNSVKLPEEFSKFINDNYERC